MEKLQLGKIVNAVGLKGEVKVYPYTDEKEFFEQIDSLLIKNGKGKEERYELEHVRYIKEMAILKLKGVDDRTAAEGLKNYMLFLYREEAPALPEGTYYIKDLIGMSIIDEEKNVIGRLKNVIKNSSQDLYEIEREDGNGTFLVPAVEAFIPEIDFDGRKITVHLIEGIMDLA